MRALLLVALLAACGPRAAPPPPARPIALTLAAADGGELDLAEHRGKLIVLHGFTTWSIEATGDAAQLEALHARGVDDVLVIGIALDVDGYPLVAPWRKALGIHYLVTVADDAMRTGGGPLGSVNAVPFTIILDRRGAIARRLDRPLRDGELDELLEQL